MNVGKENADALAFCGKGFFSPFIDGFPHRGRQIARQFVRAQLVHRMFAGQLFNMALHFANFLIGVERVGAKIGEYADKANTADFQLVRKNPLWFANKETHYDTGDHGRVVDSPFTNSAIDQAVKLHHGDKKNRGKQIKVGKA